MKIIKNINKNNMTSSISEQDKEIMLENAANTFNLKWQREGERRKQQSTADMIKAMQKVKLVPEMAPAIATVHDALYVPQAKENALQNAVVISPQPTLDARQTEEQRMRELRADREEQRRQEQSMADKMLKLMPKAKVIPEVVVVAPKRKANAVPQEIMPPVLSHCKAMGFFEAQAQQIKAIKLERELQRRADQGKQDRVNAAQKRSAR